LQQDSSTVTRCREERAAQKQVRDAAKRGDVASARLIARELVRSRRATTQLYTNKAHMISMGTQLQEQMAMVKVAGTLKKSTEVMKIVNDMMKASFVLVLIHVSKRCSVLPYGTASSDQGSRRSGRSAGARHERDHDGAQQGDDESRHHRRGTPHRRYLLYS